MGKEKVIKGIFLGGVLALGILMFGLVAKASWETEVLELESGYSISGQDNAIILDSQGNPAIVYDYNGIVDEQMVYQLKYAKKTANGWTSEVVETTTTEQQSIGWNASLVLDSNNQPHLAYWVKENWESKTGPYAIHLKYAKKTESGWQKETVLSFNSNSNRLAHGAITIKANAAGNPSILYIGDIPSGSGGYYKTNYAYKDADGWHADTLLYLFPDTSCEDATFAFDSNYKPHVIMACRDNYVTENNKSYYDSVLYHTWKKDDAWQSSEVVDKNSKLPVSISYDYYKHLSMVLDNSGNPYVLYHDMGNKILKFAEKSSGAWNTETVDGNFIASDTSPINIYFKNSIALDSENYVRIAYHDFITKNLKYGKKTNSGWEIQTLFSEPLKNEGGLPSLTIDSSGSTHMSHIGKSGTSDYTIKYTHYIPEEVFVTKNTTAEAAEAKGDEKLIGEKDSYLVNNFVFSFLKLPKKLQEKKYYIKNKKFEKYPTNYASAKKMTLKKYWKVTSNLAKYKAGKKKNKYSLRLMFAYDQSEFKALQKQNKKLKEKQLKLKYYNVKTGKWTQVPKSKQNTTRNFFYVTLKDYIFPLNTLFAVGK